MKAMIMEGFGRDLVLGDLPEPPLKPGFVKVAIKACGVCHTDLKIKHGLLPVCKEIKFPHVLGHEAAGTVEAAGPGVSDFSPGDRVVISFYSGCGRCEFCRRGEDALCSNLQYWAGFRHWGGYAEKMVVPARSLTKIPAGLEFKEVCIAADAIATVYRALVSKARVKAGERVIIIGAGGLGLHAVQIARHLGAETAVVDVNRQRLDLALTLGAAAASSPDAESLRSALGISSALPFADAVIDLIGRQESFDFSFNCLKKGGRHIVVGYKPGMLLTSNPLDLVLGEYMISGSRSSSKAELQATLDLMAAGDIRAVVHQVVPLEEVNAVHFLMEEGRINGRAVLTV